jgi:hypothetical protein
MLTIKLKMDTITYFEHTTFYTHVFLGSVLGATPNPIPLKYRYHNKEKIFAARLSTLVVNRSTDWCGLDCKQKPKLIGG